MNKFEEVGIGPQGTSLGDSLNRPIEQSTIASRSMRGAAVTMVSQSIKFIIQFATQVALAHLLDPAQFGLVAMAAPVLGFVQIFSDLGLSQAVIQRKTITQSQLSGLFWINVIFSTIFAVILILSAPLVAWVYGEPRTIMIIVALAGLLLASGLSTQHMALLNRNMRFVTLSIIDLSNLVISVTVGIIAAYLGCGYWSLVLMQAASSFTTLILSWSFSNWRPSRPKFEGDLWSLISFGGNITGANFAVYASTVFDNVIVGVVSGKVALGLYDRSYKLIMQPLSQLMTPINRVAVPTLSRLIDTPEKYSRTYIHMLQMMLLLGSPGILFFIFFAKPVVALLLGLAWIEAAPIVAWICFGALVSVLYSTSFWLFISQGRVQEHLKFTLITAAINVVAFSVGINWGPVGVSGLSAVSFVLLQTPIMCWAATRSGPVSLRSLGAAVFPFIIAGIITAFSLKALVLMAPLSSFFPLFISAFSTYILFSAVLLILPTGRNFLIQCWNLKKYLRKI